MKKSSSAKNQGLSTVKSDITEKYLTFFIDSQLYTIPTSEVVEIIRIQPITFMPNLPNYVKGVINIRGKIVPLIDMRLKFCKEEKKYDGRTSVIIVENGEMTVGLIVDSVQDVRDVTENQISASPKYKKSAGDHYVRGIVTFENKSAMLLDIEKVLVHKTTDGKKAAETDSTQPVLETAAQ